MRQKERRMHQARILAQAGHKQKDIAERLGVSPRMVRYYLSDPEVATTIATRPSKLAPYILTVQSILEEDPFHNLMVVITGSRASGMTAGPPLST